MIRPSIVRSALLLALAGPALAGCGITNNMHFQAWPSQELPPDLIARNAAAAEAMTCFNAPQQTGNSVIQMGGKRGDLYNFDYRCPRNNAAPAAATN